ncbi:hypothetical protein [Sulfurimonas sp. HSL3-7]|uniref:hypothetical protein n=1 Tax=Sulfonitrofixus jiaomeiensis TaxID=3131938 RepID=UPI0031F7F508
MKKLKWFFSMLAVTLVLLGCGDEGGGSSLPIGVYESSENYIELDSDGHFTLINFPNTIDGRNFTVSGTFTYTKAPDKMYDNIYGQIEFTVESIILEGSNVNFFYFDDAQLNASFTEIGDRLEGWWAYSSEYTNEAAMRVYFNWPGIPRGATYYEGHNEVFHGDKR